MIWLCTSCCTLWLSTWPGALTYWLRTGEYGYKHWEGDAIGHGQGHRHVLTVLLAVQDLLLPVQSVQERAFHLLALGLHHLLHLLQLLFVLLSQQL